MKDKSIPHDVLHALQRDAFEYSRVLNTSHRVLTDSYELCSLIHIINQLGSLTSTVLNSLNFSWGEYLGDDIFKKMILRKSVHAWAPQTLSSLVQKFVTSGVQYWLDLPERINERLENISASGPHPLHDIILERATKKSEEAKFLSNLRNNLLKRRGEYLFIAEQLIANLHEVLASRKWKIGSNVSRYLIPFNRKCVESYLPPIKATEALLVISATLDQWKAKNIGAVITTETTSTPVQISESKDFRQQAFYPAPDTVHVNYADSFPPRLSLIVLNRNGGNHLRNLFHSFLTVNSYQKSEFIIVDHASTDNSLEVIKFFQNVLPITLLEFDCNNTFSKGNNLAVEHAKGDVLCFLNNDIIFNEDVLEAAVNAVDSSPHTLHGMNLYYPQGTNENPAGIKKGNLQHGGIHFLEDCEYAFFRPFNYQKSSELSSPAAVTAAVVFCNKTSFEKVGGFDEDYNYGYEDVDLSLKFYRAFHECMHLLPEVSLLHNESATQVLQSSEELRNRRLGNIHALKLKHGIFLKKQILWDKLNSLHHFTDTPLHVGFVVTEAGENAVAGDYFTALELGTALEKEFNWKVSYIPRLGSDRDCYDLSGLDVAIVMLHGYDLGKIHTKDSGRPLTIAWMRNWFAQWTKFPWFLDYDHYCCSSEIAQEFLKDEFNYEPTLLRIATNEAVFSSAEPKREYKCDYCFIGSYSHANRDIEQYLDPESVKGDFLLFGSGWEGHLNFRKYFRGALPYARVPEVYASTKIVLDDANHVTKQWGSVNSRVFDALASGALVITNSQTASDDAFDGKLPVYTGKEDLTNLLNHFLTNEQERIALVTELQDIIRRCHTYSHRAYTLKESLKPLCSRPLRVSIKVPVPRESEKQFWGDYHFARDLQEALKSFGYAVRLDIIPDWYKNHTLDEIVIVIRGKSEYIPDESHINILWNISSPEYVSAEEYNKYDHVFVASNNHCRKLKPILEAPVSPLLQCTNPRRFYPDYDSRVASELLFVGNSRMQRRPAVVYATNNNLPIEVYGREWDGLIPSQFVKGQSLENKELRRYYSSAKVVLNDHWETMKDNGFVSNRIFDAGSCGAMVLSDYCEELVEIFGDLVHTYKDESEFVRLTKTLLNESDHSACTLLMETIRKEHTFANRAETIHKVISKLWDDRHLNDLALLQTKTPSSLRNHTDKFENNLSA